MTLNIFITILVTIQIVNARELALNLFGRTVHRLNEQYSDDFAFCAGRNVAIDGETNKPNIVYLAILLSVKYIVKKYK